MAEILDRRLLVEVHLGKHLCLFNYTVHYAAACLPPFSSPNEIYCAAGLSTILIALGD